MPHKRYWKEHSWKNDKVQQKINKIGNKSKYLIIFSAKIIQRCYKFIVFKYLKPFLKHTFSTLCQPKTDKIIY